MDANFSGLNGAGVLILGLGDSGLAMARWCAQAGARVRVWDSRSAPPQAAKLAQDVPQAQFFSGDLSAAALADATRVLKSPGLSPLDARLAPLLSAAQAAGVPVQGELDVFAQALAELRAQRGYAPKVLAITGTNGKTTTTSLTAKLVERCDLSVGLAGNIGPSLLDTLGAALAADALPQVWVLELSSFQLDGVQGLEPTAGAVLNITQDHLDWHGNMQAYAQAKARIFGEHAVMVLNRDDALVEALAEVPAPTPPSAAPGRGRPRQAAARQVPTRNMCRFGLNPPQQAGDFGLVVENGMAWLVRALPAEDVPPKRGAAAQLAAEPLHLQRLMPADALRIRGRHNAANALAALALATAAGCPLAPMLHGLREYTGEPHRVELIGQVAGVEAFDDSKGTNVGATVAALTGLGADKLTSKLIVILGGDGKGQDFAPLAQPVASHVRAVALIGRDAPAIEAALAGTGVLMQHHASLEAAVPWCFAQAQPGDAVLLSPACASLDMFRNYAHRAQVFIDAVRELGFERGELGA
jgi:UDP-N-acetylmuramoylalanine--D-glutamate ligase